MDYTDHEDYGTCGSCLWGDEDTDAYPCKKCEPTGKKWTEYQTSEAWKGRIQREEKFSKDNYNKKERKENRPMENKDQRPTSEQSVHLVNALEHFNHELFEGALPLHKLMMVFTRNPHIVGGYFSPDKWEDDDGNPIHEVALNSNTMQMLTPVEVMGIVVHELVHFWQWELGKPTRNGYHNTQWCTMAEEIGLECYDPATGERTLSAQNIHTKIAKDGLVEAAIAEMEEGMFLPYTGRPEPDSPPQGGGGGGGGKQDDSEPQQKRGGKRAKYTCAFCGLNVWAKSGVSIMCMQTDCSGNTILIEQK